MRDLTKFAEYNERAKVFSEEYREINRNMGFMVLSNQKISANLKGMMNSFNDKAGEELEKNYSDLTGLYDNLKHGLISDINIEIENEIYDKRYIQCDDSELEVGEEDYLQAEDYQGNAVQVVKKLVYRLIEVAEIIDIDLCERRSGILFEPAYNFYANKYEDSKELEKIVEIRVNDFQKLIEYSMNRL